MSRLSRCCVAKTQRVTFYSRLEQASLKIDSALRCALITFLVFVIFSQSTRATFRMLGCATYSVVAMVIHMDIGIGRP